MDRREPAEGIFGRAPRLLEHARAGDFALLDLSPNSPRAASRSIIEQSRTSGREVDFKKTWRPASAIAPTRANHRVQRRKYQGTIELERRVFSNVISTRSGSSSWTIQPAAKPYANFIRVAGVKFIFLPKHAPDLDPIERMIFARL